jgi:integrase
MTLDIAAVDKAGLEVLLKTRGRHMSRAKYQRPEVYAWKGKSGLKFWKAEWRQYIDGRAKPKHRAFTWLCSKYTKAKAQEECDRLVREETGGAPRVDGSMTVGEFWQKVYLPEASHRISITTKRCYVSSYRVYMEPAIGAQELQHVTKSGVCSILDVMADAGKGEQTIRRILVLIHKMFAEAVENGYVVKNPAHRVTMPRCKPPEETRAMGEAEVRALFTKTEGRDRLEWRTMVLTGIRIGELLALRKDDLVDGVLRIDESSFEGKSSTTKNGKTRYAPLPNSLNCELEDWAKGIPGEFFFPTRTGTMAGRTNPRVQDMLERARAAAGIPDLTFRMCRTTFTTLFEGDIRDAQAILGHGTADFTMRAYRKPIVERQRASLEELDARLSGKVVTLTPRKQKRA